MADNYIKTGEDSNWPASDNLTAIVDVWEYMSVSINRYSQYTEVSEPEPDDWINMNILGQEGWELVSTHFDGGDRVGIAFFKKHSRVFKKLDNK